MEIILYNGHLYISFYEKKCFKTCICTTVIDMAFSTEKHYIKFFQMKIKTKVLTLEVQTIHMKSHALFVLLEKSSKI